MRLRNDKIIVFGGGSGIGKAIAKRFCDAGATVIIAGRNEEKLKSAVLEINADNLYCKAFDITKIKEHMSFFDECAELLGGLNAFVNAAALGTSQLTGRDYEPWDITEEEWDTLTDINFKAAFFLMRNEIDYMLERKIRGNILNIASNAACMDIIGSYGASKEAKVEGVKRNNFFGTYLLGPFLISNPLFTKELMKKLGVENPVLPYEADIMKAYEVRLAELNKDIVFN